MPDVNIYSEREGRQFPDEEYDAVVTCTHGSWVIKSWDIEGDKLPCGCYFREDPDVKPVIESDWFISMHAGTKEWKMDDA